MALEFRFQAKGPDGRVVKGKVLGESANDVKTRLRAKGFQPVLVEPFKSNKKNIDLFQQKVKTKELQIFLRQLSVLLSSGVPLLESLQSLQDSSFSSGLGSILATIVQDISEGKTFSDALARHPSVFSSMVVNLVAAGEQSGVLDTVLFRIAVYYEKRQRIQSKVKSALMYPAITIAVAVSSLSAIMVFVIPRFEKLFQSQNKKLPSMTQFVVNTSDAFIAHWHFVFFIVLIVPIILVALYKANVIRRPVDEIMLKIPLFGPLVKKSVVARMARTLSTLLKAGIRINDGIEITIGTMGNTAVDAILERVKAEILTGKPFSELLKASNLFPTIVVQMVSIGEKTGNLDSMLEKVADFYEEEVENMATALTSLLEPLVIVVLGGMIGALVVSMFLPVFSLGDVVV